MALPRPILEWCDDTGLLCPEAMVLVSGDIFRTGDEHGLVSLLLCLSSDDMGKVARMGPLLLVGDCCILGDTWSVLDMTISTSDHLRCPSLRAAAANLARQEPRQRDNPGVINSVVFGDNVAPQVPSGDVGGRRPMESHLCDGPRNSSVALAVKIGPEIHALPVCLKNSHTLICHQSVGRPTNHGARCCGPRLLLTLQSIAQLPDRMTANTRRLLYIH